MLDSRGKTKFCSSSLLFVWQGHEVYAFSCIYLRILVSKHNFHIRVCLCLLRVARQVTLLEQELFALPGHMNSPQYFVVIMFLSFLCDVLWIIACLFVPFHLNIPQSVLRFTSSDYLPSIFRLSRQKWCNCIVIVTVLFRNQYFLYFIQIFQQI